MKKIIFDTDMGVDCDDAAALAILLNAHKKGECALIGVTASSTREGASATVQVIADYYGVNVPVARMSAPPNPCDAFNHYSLHIKNRYKVEDSKLDSVPLLRKLLAESEEKVSLVVVGPMSNIAGLLRTKADEYSPLDGKALVKEKVDVAYIMGGSFHVGESPEQGIISKYVFSEWNILQDIPSAIEVANNLPCETLFVPHEAGYSVWTNMKSGDNPVWECMKAYAISEKLWNGKEFARHSWDPVTALCPMHDLSPYFVYSAYGKVTIDEHGTTKFVATENGKDRYLIPRENYQEVANLVNARVERE